MRVLVTGGSGFIGSHIVDKLRDHGVTVRVFDVVAPEWRDDLEYRNGSILSEEQLRLAMAGCDAVIHTAAVADVKDVHNEPGYSEQVNVRGTANVLEAMRRTGVKRIVYSSTTWVYSDAVPTKVDETTPLGAPSHLYTATKITGEYYCHSYAKLYGLEPTILRYGIPYGPRARPTAVIPIFVGKALRGEPLTVQGDGLQFRNFVYVEDLAEGNVLALKPVAKNKIYNLDGTRKVSILEIAETVKKVVGDAKIEYLPARAGDFSGKEVDSTRAKVELGWEAKTDLEEGVRRYVDWVKRTDKERSARWATVDPRLRE